MVRLKINNEPKIEKVIGFEDLTKLTPESMFIVQIGVDSADELNDYVEHLSLRLKELFGGKPGPTLIFTHKHISIAEVVAQIEENSNKPEEPAK